MTDGAPDPGGPTQPAQPPPGPGQPTAWPGQPAQQPGPWPAQPPQWPAQPPQWPAQPPQRPAQPPPWPAQPPQYLPAGPGPGLQYAGFWRRLLAALIDTLVVVALVFGAGLIGAALPGSGPAAVIGATIIVVVVFGGWLALQILVPGRTGGTLGMRALGMWIVREQDGSQIGYALAAGRLGVYMALGWLTFGVGTVVDVLFVAFDARKQAVHDKACSTLVIRRI